MACLFRLRITSNALATSIHTLASSEYTTFVKTCQYFFTQNCSLMRYSFDKETSITKNAENEKIIPVGKEILELVYIGANFLIGLPPLRDASNFV